MKIDVSNLLNNDDSSIDINYSLNLDDFIYGTYNPIKKGVAVKGRAYLNADVVYLELDFYFDFDGFCDRCAEELSRPMNFSIKRILVHALSNNSDLDDYIVVENGIIDIDELAREEIQLYLPRKILCKEDCKGLCFKCGKNLNFEKCSCENEIDPRMAALLQLLDE